MPEYVGAAKDDDIIAWSNAFACSSVEIGRHGPIERSNAHAVPSASTRFRAATKNGWLPQSRFSPQQGSESSDELRADNSANRISLIYGDADSCLALGQVCLKQCTPFALRICGFPRESQSIGPGTTWLSTFRNGQSNRELLLASGLLCVEFPSRNPIHPDSGGLHAGT